MRKIILLLSFVLLLGASCTPGQNSNDAMTNDVSDAQALSGELEAKAEVMAEGDSKEPVVAGTKVSGEAAVAVNNKPIMVVRDIDGYGCLVAAGFQKDFEIRACVRSADLDQQERVAARMAVAEYGPTYSLTVLSVQPGSCATCHQVNLEAYGEESSLEVDISLVK